MELGDDVPLIRTGIAWPTDKEIKFKNPPGDDLKKGKINLKDYFEILFV